MNTRIIYVWYRNLFKLMQYYDFSYFETKLQADLNYICFINEDIFISKPYPFHLTINPYKKTIFS